MNRPAFSFVHAADLHLDSPFATLSSTTEYKRIAGRFRDATFQSFRGIVQLCLDKRVDFLVVAGDVYDEANRCVATQDRFRGELQRLADAGIRSFVVHGNHDPMDARCAQLAFPKDVHVFGFSDAAEPVEVRKGGETVAVVHGLSYPTRDMGDNLAPRFSRRGPPGLFNIGLLHCNLDGDPAHGTYAPCSTKDLMDRGLDYWALGHIHRAHVPKSPPWIVYPGNPQGRHIRETGRKGCVLVRVDARGGVTLEPHYTDVVTWSWIDIDIAESGDADALLKRIQAALQQQPSAAALRIRLRGRGPAHRTLRDPVETAKISDLLREEGAARDPFVWIDGIEISTRSPMDLQSMRDSDSFPGALLRAFDGLRSPERRADLEALLKEVYGSRNRPEEITDEFLRDVLAEAETLCLDPLAPEESG